MYVHVLLRMHVAFNSSTRDGRDCGTTETYVVGGWVLNFFVGVIPTRDVAQA